MLRNLNSITFTILLGVFASCVDHHAELTQDQEEQRLQDQFSRIMSLASNASCTDSSGWAFTAIGSAVCGGPGRYIIYSTSIDTVMFFKEIETYTVAQMAFNKKWPVGGGCALPLAPTGVACIDGVPVLTY